MKQTAWKKLIAETEKRPLEERPAQEPVLLRDKVDHRLHVVNRLSNKVDAKGVEVPDAWTEVIGWHAGKQIVRVRPLPEC